MRTNEKTIKLAKIRRHIREAIKWNKVDGGSPAFYSSENYKTSKRGYAKDGYTDFYYTKSDRAIEEIAEKIYEIVEGKS